MKRMYVILSIMLLCLVGIFAAFAQVRVQVQNHTTPRARTPFDRQKRRAELREEMHRRIRDMLINGRGDQNDLFKDLEQEFQENMAEAFADMDQSSLVSNFSSEWTENKNGRTLEIIPKDTSQKINIDVNATTITIKGETKQQSGTTSISSAFNNSFPVPGDCDGTKVKMNSKNGKILVELPYRLPPKVEKKPLTPKSSDDIEI